MQLSMYQVDAFADALFRGNPAAVCPVEDWPNDDTLQLIARENNLSETAFYAPEGDGQLRLRWFTPGGEVDLCGHATLGTAAVIFRSEPERREIQFLTRSGPLGAKLVTGPTGAPEGSALTGDPGLTIELDFPAVGRTGNAPERAAAEEALGTGRLGTASLDAWKTAGESDLVLLFDSEATVRSLEPDFRALGQLDARGVTVTADGDDPEIDYVSRFFAPRHNIDEDPATGSAQCYLAPYWSKVLGKDSLEARQLSSRLGTFSLQVSPERVKLRGQAFFYLEGTIQIA